MEPNKTLKAVIDTKYIDTRTQESLKQGIMELLNLSLEEMVEIFMSIDAPTGKEPLEWIRDFLSDYVGEETLEYIQMFHLSRRLHGTDLKKNDNALKLLPGSFDYHYF